LANNDTNVNLSLIGAGKGTNDVNAKYNWWGTIDTTLISRSIFDFEDDFNLGRVTFVPFLTTPNSEAPIAVPISASTPSPTPTVSPTPTLIPTPSPIQAPEQSFFFIESNSTVTELFFNSTSSELNFTVNGTSGTAGYVKVTIAKSLFLSVQKVKV
jgi:hypothetical protein